MKLILLTLVAAMLGIQAKPIKEMALAKQLFNDVHIQHVAWAPFDDGFATTPQGFLLDNGSDANGKKGVGKIIPLNQTTPRPIRVMAESKAENIPGTPSRQYSIYLDLVFQDGTHRWGIIKPFSTGTHDWETQSVTYRPLKPIRELYCWLVLRTSGKATFRNLRVQMAKDIPGTQSFDGQLVKSSVPYDGWLFRDVKANSDYLSCTQPTQTIMGITLDAAQTVTEDATFRTLNLQADAPLKEDRIINLTYVEKLPEHPWQWLSFSREKPQPATAGEHMIGHYYAIGSNGSASKMPFAAVATDTQGRALGMDLQTPAYGRAFYNADTRELAVTWDIALTPENSHATLKLVSFTFKPTWGLRSAFAKLYHIYPDAFKVRVKKQGLWMAFAQISKVENFQDFGFAIKEGHNETQWDDQNDILTFRYTEPMTWWMTLKKGQARTLQNSWQEALRQEKEAKGLARAFSSSVHLDATGKPYGLHKDTPWCDGIVWSMNSMPGIKGTYTDFNQKWNKHIFNRFYGPQAKGIMDGEYVDSSEGYVTAIMDYSRQHLQAARTPITFATDTLQPGIFRGLIAYEYIKALADDLHPRGKLTMANATPLDIWFFAPLLDVMGTETDWNRSGNWYPTPDERLLFTRAMCGQKPFCFLQNTNYDLMGVHKVEKYMKRSLFYGMYPGFFSGVASSSSHYFKTPRFYNRDRHLFKKYVPLCKLVGEAGWQPETMASTSNSKVWIERFGTRYFTLFNATDQTQRATVTFHGKKGQALNLITKETRPLKGERLDITLEPEDVMLLDLQP